MIDWESDEERLLAYSIKSIKEFFDAHPDELFSYFAFDCSIYDGIIRLCLDTPANSMATARKNRDYQLGRREKYAKYEDCHESSKTWIKEIVPYSDNTGEFAYQNFDSVKFAEWSRFFDSPEYPDQENDDLDDYITGNSRILICRVIHRLATSDVFPKDKITHPFLLGYCFSEDEDIQHVLWFIE